MRHLPIPAAVREFLRDEARAGNIIIWGLASIGAACFFAAVLAITFLK